MTLLKTIQRSVTNAKLQLAAACCLSVTSALQAQVIRVTVENPAPLDGFYLAPMFVGFHDGSYDSFEFGAVATPGLERLAEDGPPDLLTTEFTAPGRAAGAVVGPLGFGSMPGQPPVIDGGEIASTLVPISDPATARFFTFASMLVPSNDAFIGNGNPLAHQIFDAAGSFLGPITVDVFGAEVWDAGTEVNDRMGAAFSTIGGVSSDEGGTVHVHPGLDNFEGTGTPVGTVGAGLAPGANDLVARITITLVPEPVTFALAALALSYLFALPRRAR